jgi:phosphoglycerate dehydrogenase-like enzyme
MKIAILDDYQNVALKMADWSALAARAEITVFNDHLADPEALVERLAAFEILCVMRERTPLPREVLQRPLRLKLIASTGPGNASIDSSAAKELGIAVTGTGYKPTPTIELTWALILASVRSIVRENEALRAGRWQTSIGEELSGKTLGVLGLGNIGGKVAQIGLGFGMNVIAWSQNLTQQIAGAAGAKLVSREQLFCEADILTIHLILSARTRGLVGPAELALMKPMARLINTSRGPIVDESSLIKALRSHAIASAAIDVFDQEPLPPEHPFRTMDNVLATPHIGYVSDSLYRMFYGDVVKSITAWLDKHD